VTNNAQEVPLVEKLRSVPKDYRTCVAIQWSESGSETGHRFIPVGYMMHEAADEIESLREQLALAFEAGRVAEREECATVCEEIRVVVDGNHPWTALHVQNQCIDAIRARSTKAP
jgi:hypothetical protein